MLPQHAPAPQSPRTCIGVGIDTSRYGHYAVFLRDDLQPADDELAFAESAAGYALLQQRLARYRPPLSASALRRPPRRRRTLCRQPAALFAPTGHAQRRRGQRRRAVGPHYLLRRSATQQELPRRTLRQSEVRSRRGPRRCTLRPHRTTAQRQALVTPTPPPPPGGRTTASRRPPTHPPAQPAPSPAGRDLPRTGPAHQGPRRRLGPRTDAPLSQRPHVWPRPRRPICRPSPICPTPRSPRCSNRLTPPSPR